MLSFFTVDDKDLSTLSDVSDIGTNLTTHNTTTSALNKILERVNVNDSLGGARLPDPHNNSDDFSEVSEMF